MRIMKPKDEEIDDVLNVAVELEDSGRNPYHGMTYTQGVKDGIEWMQNGGEPPLDQSALEG